MRSIRMAVLAGAATLAAMAFVGTGTAAADSACLVDPGTMGACPAASVWNGPIIGLSGEALFKVDNTVTKCKSSFLADYVVNEGAHVGVLYLILNLNFFECVGACPNAFSENLPALLLVAMVQQHAKLTGDGNGTPAVLLQNCMILDVPMSCLYKMKTPVLSNYVLELKEGLPLVGALRFNTEMAWGGDDALCPQNAVFQATYLIYEDQEFIEGPELFFTALP